MLTEEALETVAQGPGLAWPWHGTLRGADPPLLHDFHLGNFPIKGRIDDKAGYALGLAYLVMTRCYHSVSLDVSVRSNQDVGPECCDSCSFFFFWLPDCK